MRRLPIPDPGTPDARSPGRYLWWVLRGQWTGSVSAMLFGIVWMVAQALMPATIGQAIDGGLAHRDPAALLGWAGALLGLGVVQAVGGIFRHRFSTSNWLTAAYRTVQVVTRHSARLGATLPKRVATGEVVSIGTNDIERIGGVADILGRGAGAVCSFVTVAMVLLATSVPLGLLVLIGVPLLMLVVGPLLRPLHRRQQAQRTLTGELTSYAGDIVTGLRVLRGIGGEETFSARYRERSQRVRAAGVRVARVESLLDATQVFLPGIFVVLVTWLGARFALAGLITPGQLVAFYGYAAFLVVPLETGTEAAWKFTNGLVAAGRVVRVLELRPEFEDPAEPVPVPPVPAPGAVELVDEESGLRLRQGELTVVVTATLERAAALADRLGRYAPGPVTLRGVPTDRLRIADLRDRVLVADTEAQLFAGVLRAELDPTGTAGETRIRAALGTASADDVLAGLAGGLDAEIEERGRSLSGGQRQRLLLARALLADPEVLILVEPTSAVDAHTEARIADRLRAHRAGRTTVLFSGSPLLADRADRVVFLPEDRVVAEGGHAELLAGDARYRLVVTRGEDDPVGVA